MHHVLSGLYMNESHGQFSSRHCFLLLVAVTCCFDVIHFQRVFGNSQALQNINLKSSKKFKEVQRSSKKFKEVQKNSKFS
jgi:hypothetical protein